MPSFILLKQFGGVLPAPNGFKYTDSNTISAEELTSKKNNNKFEDEKLENSNYVPEESINPNIPPHLTAPVRASHGGMVKNEESEFGLDDEDFWKWVKEEEEKSEER